MIESIRRPDSREPGRRRSATRRRAGIIASASGLLLSVVLLAGASGSPETPQAGAQTPQHGRSTRDGVFTKEQAAAGQALFDKTCSGCHRFKPWEKSEDNPDLAGQAFLDKWTGRSVRELETLIFTTMPNDGSAVLSEDETTSLAAYILQQNGFPPGTTALPWGAPAAQIAIGR